MPRVKQSNPRRVPKMFRKTTTYRRRKPAQKKFNLPKPRRKVVNQLSNLLETKKFQGLDYDYGGSLLWIQNPIEEGDMPLTNAGVSFIPDSFYRMQFQSDFTDANFDADDKDLLNTCIEGNSIFSKYLKVKVQIDYPDGLEAPIQCPRPVEVIWGWVNPLNFTEFTTPKIDEVTPANIREHTLDAIAAEFNSMTDNMEFHDKHRRRYNIIGRRKVMPDTRRSVPTRALSGSNSTGSSGKILTNINFPMMKKVNYTRSKATLDVNTPQFAYPNEAYIPFVYLYNPDYAMYNVSGVKAVKFKINDCHWFNDA